MSDGPNSPDLNPEEDYNIWQKSSSEYTRQNFIMLKNWTSIWLTCGMVWSKVSSITLSAISCATDECHRSNCPCIHVIERHFWQLVIPYHPSAVLLFILWKLEVSWCCCVKYTRILLLLLFYVSQGRKETYLRSSGNVIFQLCCKFLARFSSDRIFEIARNLPVTNECRVACFLTHSV